MSPCVRGYIKNTFEERFFEIFQDVCDEISLEYVISIMREVDYKAFYIEQGVDRYGNNIVACDICPTAFYSLQVLSNDPCFIAGNIYCDSIDDIFFHEQSMHIAYCIYRGKNQNIKYAKFVVFCKIF